MSSKIRNFLLQLPKPALIRVTTGEGETEEIKPSKGYAKAAKTIEALDPQLVQCFCSDGKLLRAMRFDSIDSRRSDAAEIPAGIALDPQALMLTHFANLLHRAYEHSTEVAFEKMHNLMEAMNARSDSIEQRLERTEATNRRLLQEQVDDALDRAQEVAEQAAEGGGSMQEQMASQFLAGMMNGSATRKPNGAAPSKKPE